MKTVYENPWFKVTKNGLFHYIEENGSDNGAVIVIIEGESFVFVKVNRPAHSDELIEFPRGYANHDESSKECALRELLEETGYVIERGSIEKLGVVKPNTAILASTINVFLAHVSKEEQVQEHDSEVIEIIRIPISEMKQKILSGLVVDGISLSALALFWCKYP
ncbi:NUDIX hydrolase [Photobacterium lutimaris]|uniref:NUDIX hydrolase n=1 Tax=Photobacterium lutimaris TaxID=388278 RepID=UPI0010E6A96C|nr:NUDIX hydrolase [Photobacterium lutimaris]TDR69162.1 ADP-ribose pyrophosphatase [Photobacterium lutimaris]